MEYLYPYVFRKRKSGWCFFFYVSSPGQLPIELLRKVWIHPRNLTWNQKRMVSKSTFLFQALIFRFHVEFWGCMFSLWIVSWGLLRVYLIHIRTCSVVSSPEKGIYKGLKIFFQLPWFTIGGGFKYCLCSPVTWGNESIWRACFWNGLKLPTIYFSIGSFDWLVYIPGVFRILDFFFNTGRCRQFHVWNV